MYLETFLVQDGLYVVVLLKQVGLELDAEDIFVQEVPALYARPRDLVLVGGAYAAAGGPYLVVTAQALPCYVQLLVVRHDEVRVLAYEQVFGAEHLAGFEELDLRDEHLGVHDNAVAYNAPLSGVEYAGGKQVEDVLLGANDNRMARVVAPLKAHDYIGRLGEYVYDFSLALIAPLGADYNKVPDHLDSVPIIFFNIPGARRIGRGYSASPASGCPSGRRAALQGLLPAQGRHYVLHIKGKARGCRLVAVPFEECIIPAAAKDRFSYAGGEALEDDARVVVKAPDLPEVYGDEVLVPLLIDYIHYLLEAGKGGQRRRVLREGAGLGYYLLLSVEGRQVQEKLSVSGAYGGGKGVQNLFKP